MSIVTCIVPNYNHARFLPERLDSILEQTRMPDEIILLDDTSSDNSREILQKYAERYPDLISCHFNEENSGSPFAQWKKGVDLASGEFIWLAESDDVADPRFLETLVPMLDADPKVGVAYCQSHTIDEEGKNLGDMHFWTDALDTERWKSCYTNDGNEECVRYVSRRNTIPNASAVLFKKSAYDCVSSLPLSFRLAGDWLVWVSMLQKYDISYTPEKLNYYRYHGGTVRSQTSNIGNRAESWWIQQYVMREFAMSSRSKFMLASQQLQHIDPSLPVLSKESNPNVVIAHYKKNLSELFSQMNEKLAKGCVDDKDVYLPLAALLVDYGNKYYSAGKRKTARRYYLASLDYNFYSARMFLFLVSTYVPLLRKLTGKFIR